MGQVRVTIAGSFTNCVEFEASAREGGHAMALCRAIKFLNAELPAAIRKDHALQRRNAVPDISDFGKLKAHLKEG